MHTYPRATSTHDAAAAAVGPQDLISFPCVCVCVCVWHALNLGRKAALLRRDDQLVCLFGPRAICVVCVSHGSSACLLVSWLFGRLHAVRKTLIITMSRGRPPGSRSSEFQLGSGGGSWNHHRPLGATSLLGQGRLAPFVCIRLTLKVSPPWEEGPHTHTHTHHV